MVYPDSGPYSSQDHYSSTGYNGYWPQSFSVANRRTSPEYQLVWAVLLLGLATYILSYVAVAQPGPAEWGVRFSTFAAVVAALDLLPRRSAHTKLMVALAIMGFLESLSQWITGDQSPGWTTIVIVVLTGLQALTAVAAQLIQFRVSSATDRGPGLYDAYAYYAQAAQQYYAANAQQLQQQPVHGQATAQAEATAPAQAQQSTADRYALYAEYLDGQRAQLDPRASSSSRLTQTAHPGAAAGAPTSGPANSVRPGYDPAAGSSTQSPSA
jgi:hypothetical protein